MTNANGFGWDCEGISLPVKITNIDRDFPYDYHWESLHFIVSHMIYFYKPAMPLANGSPIDISCSSMCECCWLLCVIPFIKVFIQHAVTILHSGLLMLLHHVAQLFTDAKQTQRKIWFYLIATRSLYYGTECMIQPNVDQLDSHGIGTKAHSITYKPVSSSEHNTLIISA